MKNKFRRKKGVTLIALVVSIIVLLILAGISINLLTGENGIINKAAESKEKTEAINQEEKRKLAQAEALLNTESTAYRGVLLPAGFAPTKIEGEDSVDEGLVITDVDGNEYVWVEVPKTIYTDSKYNTKGSPNSENDWEKIRDCLKAYTVDYTNSSYKDTNGDGTTYSDDYKNMLKSVYTNGGFWIGRYEAGIEEDTPRIGHIDLKVDDKAVVKQDKMPWIYVTRDEAQQLAERMDYNGATSSLIYGVQWDLVLKYIETKGAATKENLTSSSEAIGNYSNNIWNITNANAKYSTDNGKKFIACPYGKKTNAGVLLTTGADVSFSLMNIYDIAGNVWEWTREFYTTNYPCTDRGGGYDLNGSNFPAKFRGIYDTTSSSYYNVGFRIGLWK